MLELPVLNSAPCLSDDMPEDLVEHAHSGDGTLFSLSIISGLIGYSIAPASDDAVVSHPIRAFVTALDETVQGFL